MNVKLFDELYSKDVSSLIIDNLKRINSKDYESNIIDNLCIRFNEKWLLDLSKVRNTYVYFLDWKVVATASLDHNMLHALFVHIDYQYRWIWTDFLKSLEDIVKSINYSYIVVSASLTSEGFFKKMWYKKILYTYSDTHWKSCIMRKDFKK